MPLSVIRFWSVYLVQQSPLSPRLLQVKQRLRCLDPPGPASWPWTLASTRHSRARGLALTPLKEFVRDEMMMSAMRVSGQFHGQCYITSSILVRFSKSWWQNPSVDKEELNVRKASYPPSFTFKINFSKQKNSKTIKLKLCIKLK